MKRSLKSVLSRELMRFVLIGGAATLIDLILYLLLGIWISASLSKCLSMSCACIFSFFMNCRWTFNIRGKITFLQMTKYIAVQLINIGVNVGVNALILHALAGFKLGAFVIATGAAMSVNFVLQKLFVFRSKLKQSWEGDF